MNSLIIYSLEVLISLALFYSAYWLFLKNETFFKLNRFYLVFSLGISLSAPLLNIGIATGENSVMTKYLVLPIERYEQSLIIKMGAGTDAARRETGGRNAGPAINVPGSDDESNYRSDASHIAPSDPNKDGYPERRVNWLAVALVIYCFGAGLLLLRFIANFIWILRQAAKQKPQQIQGMKVVCLDKKISPFSFLNFIFISNRNYPEAELSKIISHEKVHIQQKHAVDLIFFELVLILQWFNPFVWLYKRSIKLTHEYLADLGTLDSGVDLQGYQYSLLNQVLSENNIELISHYNLSIKKRITMMLKKRSSRLSALKLTVALPILIFLFSAFAFSSNKTVESSTPETIALKDTVIKRIDVAVSYLKLIEGEYVATNEPGRNRRIIFTEVMGTLFGLDNGYSYKLIPVAEGKFVNPDDHVVLLFDTKNTNEISLLLAGRINLKKEKSARESGKIPNKSLAFSLTNEILRGGTSVAIKRFKEMKDSSNYFLAESEMNWAGYELLQKGKTKEASVIFKLNVEQFPNSYNTYDSYGESLLAMGDRTGATEAYKKSVQLNPGSKSGILQLKALGVNPDDVIKVAKVSVEYLKLLEGDYLSTDEGNWVRWIRFTEEGGVLTGTDNGYKYKLIPMGDGKFINPDDGASLTFDTKDKNAISLLLFGRVNLTKVKSPRQPAEYLITYAGTYAPLIKGGIMQTFEVRHFNDKLYRHIETEPEPANRTIELQVVTDNIVFYTDRSGRSIEFLVNDKKVVTGCIVRRGDGRYEFSKQ